MSFPALLLWVILRLTLLLLCILKLPDIQIGPFQHSYVMKDAYFPCIIQISLERYLFFFSFPFSDTIKFQQSSPSHKMQYEAYHSRLVIPASSMRK